MQCRQQPAWRQSTSRLQVVWEIRITITFVVADSAQPLATLQCPTVSLCFAHLDMACCQYPWPFFIHRKALFEDVATIDIGFMEFQHSDCSRLWLLPLFPPSLNMQASLSHRVPTIRVLVRTLNASQCKAGRLHWCQHLRWLLYPSNFRLPARQLQSIPISTKFHSWKLQGRRAPSGKWMMAWRQRRCYQITASWQPRATPGPPRRLPTPPCFSLLKVPSTATPSYLSTTY